MNYCPPGTFSYLVRYGDTLWMIASNYNTTVEDLIRLNPNINPDVLQFGDIICVPLIESDIDDIDDYLELNNLIRKIWVQHNSWTRMASLYLATKFPPLEMSANRLLLTANQFYSLFLPFYGEADASRLRELLTEHILIANDVLVNLYNDNQNAYNEHLIRWEANAGELASFFSEINPFWEYETWNNMLNDHLNLIIQEARYFSGEDANQEILTNDRIQQQGFIMADYMLEGITRDFPEYFI